MSRPGHDGTNGNRYPLRKDGRTLLLLAIVAVWTAAHLADIVTSNHPVPREVDVIMAIVTGGAFGWQAIEELLRRRDGGDKP